MPGSLRGRLCGSLRGRLCRSLLRGRRGDGRYRLGSHRILDRLDDLIGGLAHFGLRRVDAVRGVGSGLPRLISEFEHPERGFVTGVGDGFADAFAGVGDPAGRQTRELGSLLADCTRLARHCSQRFFGELDGISERRLGPLETLFDGWLLAEALDGLFATLRKSGVQVGRNLEVRLGHAAQLVGGESLSQLCDVFGEFGGQTREAFPEGLDGLGQVGRKGVELLARGPDAVVHVDLCVFGALANLRDDVGHRVHDGIACADGREE